MDAEDVRLLELLLSTAEAKHGGHMTITREPDIWRICLGIRDNPGCDLETDILPAGSTFKDAAEVALYDEYSLSF